MLQDIKQRQTRNYKNKNERFYYASNRYSLRKRANKRIEETEKTEEAPQSQITVNRGPVYQCPISKENFRGPCSILQCNMNVTKYIPQDSCCLAIQFDKMQFDKWDLQNYLGITESKLYRLKEQGYKRSSKVLLLNKILENLRGSDSKIEVKDPSIISNFIRSSNLHFTELNTKISDVILIKQNVCEIEEYLSQINSEFTLAELLGTDQPIP